MHFSAAESRFCSRPAHRRHAPGKPECDLAGWKRWARGRYNHTVQRRRPSCSQSAATAATYGQDFVGEFCPGERHLACRWCVQNCNENKIAARRSNFPCTQSTQVGDGNIRHYRNLIRSTTVEQKRPRCFRWPFLILSNEYGACGGRRFRYSTRTTRWSAAIAKEGHVTSIERSALFGRHPASRN